MNTNEQITTIDNINVSPNSAESNIEHDEQNQVRIKRTTNLFVII